MNKSLLALVFLVSFVTIVHGRWTLELPAKQYNLEHGVTPGSRGWVDNDGNFFSSFRYQSIYSATNQGNPLATGTYVNIGIQKVDSNGTLMWMKTIESGVVYRMCGNSHTNQIYVVGKTQALTGAVIKGSDDMFIWSLNGTTGDQIFLKTFGTDKADSANACASGSEGVYVAGSTTGAFSPDYPVYTPSSGVMMYLHHNGTLGWLHQNGTANDHTEMLGVCTRTVDGEEQAFFTGKLAEHFEGLSGGSTVKIGAIGFSKNGTKLWADLRVANTGSQIGRSIACFNDFVVVGGSATAVLDGHSVSNNPHCALVVYHPNGTWIRSKLLDGEYCTIFGLASRGGHSLLISGAIRQGPSFMGNPTNAPNGGNRDGFFTVYRLFTDTFIYNSTLGGPEDDVFYDASSPQGFSVYMIGFTTGSLGTFPIPTRQNGDTSRNMLSMKFGFPESISGSLVTQFIRQDSSYIEETMEFRGITRHGNLYFAVGESLNPGYVNNVGNFETPQCFVVKFNETGDVLSITSFGGTGTAQTQGNDITVDPNRNSVYVAGQAAGGIVPWFTAMGNDGFVSRLDFNGTEIWHIPLQSTGDQYAMGVAVNSQGHIFVVGFTTEGLSGIPVNTTGVRDIFLAKFHPNGTRLWTMIRGTQYADVAEKIAINNNDEIFVVGQSLGDWGNGNPTKNDIILIKVTDTPTTGIVEWTRQWGASDTDQFGKTVAVVDDLVFVGGYTTGATSWNGVDFSGFNGFSTCYVVKTNATDGTMIKTQRTFSGNSPGDQCIIWEIAIAKSKLHIVGQISGAGSPLTQGLTNYGVKDGIFFTMTTADLTVGDVSRHGTAKQDAFRSLAVTPGNQVMVAGYSEGIIDNQAIMDTKKHGILTLLQDGCVPGQSSASTTFLNSPKQTSLCPVCELGKFSNITNAASCTQCTGDYWTSSTNSTFCDIKRASPVTSTIQTALPNAYMSAPAGSRPAISILAKYTDGSLDNDLPVEDFAAYAVGFANFPWEKSNIGAEYNLTTPFAATVATNYTILVRLRGIELTGSNFTLEILPGAPASKSRVFGTGAYGQQGKAGIIREFQIQARDIYDNICIYLKSNPFIGAVYPIGSTTSDGPITISQPSAGILSASYAVSESGTFTLNVTINGQLLETFGGNGIVSFVGGDPVLQSISPRRISALDPISVTLTGQFFTANPLLRVQFDVTGDAYNLTTCNVLGTTKMICTPPPIPSGLGSVSVWFGDQSNRTEQLQFVSVRLTNLRQSQPQSLPELFGIETLNVTLLADNFPTNAISDPISCLFNGTDFSVSSEGNIVNSTMATCKPPIFTKVGGKTLNQIFLSLDSQNFVRIPATLVIFNTTTGGLSPLLAMRTRSVVITVKTQNLVQVPENNSIVTVGDTPIAEFSVGPTDVAQQQFKFVVANFTITNPTPIPNGETVINVVKFRLNAVDPLPGLTSVTVYEDHGINSITQPVAIPSNSTRTLVLLSAPGKLFISAPIPPEHVKAEWEFNGTRQITLLRKISTNRLSADVTPRFNAYIADSVRVRVTLNNQQYSDWITLAVFQIQSSNPQWAPVTGNTVVTIRGIGFNQSIAGSLRCKFGVNGAAIVGQLVSHSTFTCTTPTSGLPTGTVTVLATANNVDYQSASSITFSTNPTLSDVSPSSISEFNAQTLSINGDNFINVTTILIQITGLDTIVGRLKNDRQVVFDMPSVPQGSYTIRVSFNNGIEYVSQALTLTVINPRIQSISPTSGPLTQSTSITITGSGFINDPNTGSVQVRLSSPIVNPPVMMSVSSVSTTSIVLDTPILSGYAGLASLNNSVTHPVSIEVSINNGTNVTSDGVSLSVYRQPIMQSIYPSSGRSSGGIVLELSGWYAHTQDSTLIRLNGSSWTSGLINANQVAYSRMTVVSPAAPLTTGVMNVSVEIALNGQNFVRMVNDVQFQYFKDIRVIDVSPSIAPAWLINSPIDIIGQEFVEQSTTTVQFGSGSESQSTECVLISSTKMSCGTPSLQPGTYNVEVALNGRDFSSCSGVRYQTFSPVVTSMTPQALALESRATVTVDGERLINVTLGNTMQCRVLSNVTNNVIGTCRVTSVDNTFKRMQLDIGSFPSWIGNGLADISATYPIALEVSTNGGTNYTRLSSNVVSALYSWPQFNATTPSWGELNQGINVNLIGQYAWVVSDAAVLRLQDGNGWQSDVSVTRQQDMVRFQMPDYDGTSTLPVTLNILYAVNGQQFRDTSQVVRVYRTPIIDSLTPLRKSPGEAAPVTITGSGFFDTGLINVRMGDNVYPGEFLTGTSIRVDTPVNQPRGEYTVEVALDGITFRSSTVRFAVLPIIIACPDTTQTESDNPAEKSEDCVCKPGFFDPQQRRGVDCLPCPENSECKGRQTLPLAKPGFFATGSGANLRFVRCAVPAACLGGNSSSCATGYEGRLCGSCVKGFYRLGDTCQPCQEESAAFFILIIILFFVYLFWLKRQTRVTQMGLGRVVALAITHLQVMSTFSDYQLKWPEQVQEMLNMFSIAQFNIDTAAPECSLADSWTFETRFWFTMILPLIVLVGVILRVIGQFLRGMLVLKYGHRFENRYPAFCAEPDVNQSKFRLAMSMLRYNLSTLFTEAEIVDQDTFRYVINEIVFTLGLLYITVCTRVLEIFDCSEVGNGLLVMDAAPDVECWKDGTMQSRLLIPAIVFLVLYVVGIPMMVLTIMYRAKVNNQLETQSFIQKYSTLFSRYDARFYWFEGAVLLRKGAIVATKLFATQLPALQGLIGIIVLGIATIVQFRYDPYRTRNQNRLESILLVLSTLILVSGMVFVTESVSPQAEAGWSTVTVSVAVLALLACLYYGWIEVYRKLGEMQRNGAQSQFGEKGKATKEKRDNVQAVVQELSRLVRADHLEQIKEVLENYSVSELKAFQRSLSESTTDERAESVSHLSRHFFVDGHRVGMMKYLLENGEDSALEQTLQSVKIREQQKSMKSTRGVFFSGMSKREGSEVIELEDLKK